MIPEDKFLAFERDVRALFSNAHWTNVKIAEWAGTAASGYGTYVTAKEAQPLVDEICRKHNAEIARENAEVSRAVNKDLRETFGPGGLLDMRKFGFKLTTKGIQPK